MFKFEIPIEYRLRKRLCKETQRDGKIEMDT